MPEDPTPKPQGDPPAPVGDPPAPQPAPPTPAPGPAGDDVAALQRQLAALSKRVTDRDEDINRLRTENSQLTQRLNDTSLSDAERKKAEAERQQAMERKLRVREVDRVAAGVLAEAIGAAAANAEVVVDAEQVKALAAETLAGGISADADVRVGYDQASHEFTVAVEPAAVDRLKAKAARIVALASRPKTAGAPPRPGGTPPVEGDPAAMTDLGENAWDVQAGKTTGREKGRAMLHAAARGDGARRAIDRIE